MKKPPFPLRQSGSFRFVARAFVLGLLLLTPFRDWAFPRTVADIPVPYIVALRVEPDVEDFVREYHLQPSHRYWRRLNGFSAELDGAMVARLRTDRRVAALEPEQKARAIVLLGSQTDPAAVAREFGLRPSRLYTKALKGFVARMDAEKIAQLEADQPTGGDKRMRILAIALDGSAWDIITLRRDADPDQFAAQYGIKPLRATFKYAMKGLVAAMDGATLAKVDQDDRVMAVEADTRIQTLSSPYTAGLTIMQIPGFPVSQLALPSPNFSNIGVAVMDTGIQLDHPNLNVCGNAGFAGIAEGSPGYNGDDWDGHGTQVAGIIGAFGNPVYGGITLSGVAPGVCLYSVQVIGPSGSPWSNFLAGADYIVQNAQFIDVVNASIAGLTGTTSTYTAVHEAVLGIVNQGIVFVAAAGNTGGDIAGNDLTWGNPDNTLPAALPEVMAVNAMDPNPTAASEGSTSSPGASGAPNPTYDQMWDLSNYSTIPKSPNYVNSPGLGIDVTAPGVNIPTTTIGSGFIDTAGPPTTGTSFAAPYTVGLIVDYIAANGRGNTFQDTVNIRQAIVNSSLPQTAWPSYPNTDNAGGPPPLALPSTAWVPPPTLTYAVTSQGAQISFNTVPGYDYTLLETDNLNTPLADWTPIGSPAVGSSVNVNGAAGALTLTDPAPPTTGSRYYEVQMTPEAAP